MGRKGPDFTVGPIGATLITFALPVLGSNILQSLNGSANAIWVSHVLGEAALTATSNANQIFFMMLGAAFGVTVGRDIHRRLTSHLENRGKRVDSCYVLGLEDWLLDREVVETYNRGLGTYHDFSGRADGKGDFVRPRHSRCGGCGGLGRAGRRRGLALNYRRLNFRASYALSASLLDGVRQFVGQQPAAGAARFLFSELITELSRSLKSLSLHP